MRRRRTALGVAAVLAALAGCKQGAGYLDTYESLGGDARVIDGTPGVDAPSALWQRLNPATTQPRSFRGAAVRGNTLYVAVANTQLGQLVTERYDDGVATALTFPSPPDAESAELAIASDGVPFLAVWDNGATRTYVLEGTAWRELTTAARTDLGAFAALTADGTTVDLVGIDGDQYPHAFRLDRGTETWTDLGVVASVEAAWVVASAATQPVVVYQNFVNSTGFAVVDYTGSAWQPLQTFPTAMREPALAEDSGARYVLVSEPSSVIHRQAATWTTFHAPTTGRMYGLTVSGGVAYYARYDGSPGRFSGIERFDGVTAQLLTRDVDDGGMIDGVPASAFSHRFLAVSGGYLYIAFDTPGFIDALGVFRLRLN